MYFCREQHHVRSLRGRFNRAIYDQALRYDIGDRVTIDEAHVDSEARPTEGGSPDDVLARQLVHQCLSHQHGLQDPLELAPWMTCRVASSKQPRARLLSSVRQVIFHTRVAVIVITKECFVRYKT